MTGNRANVRTASVTTNYDANRLAYRVIAVETLSDGYHVAVGWAAAQAIQHGGLGRWVAENLLGEDSQHAGAHDTEEDQ